VPYVDLRDSDASALSDFDALVALDLSVSNRSSGGSSSVAPAAVTIGATAVTTRYHPTRLPLLYQFLLSLLPPSSPSSSPPNPPPRIILQVSKVLSIWARGGGGGKGAVADEFAAPPQDAYGSYIKGNMHAFMSSSPSSSHSAQTFFSTFSPFL
jgi:hypothetical protein